MRAIVSSLGLFILSTGCVAAISGSGEVVEEERDVAAFREVSVSGDMDVDVVVGPAARVVLRYDDNLIDLVKTETDEDGVLHVTHNEDIAFYDTASQSVSIEVPALNAFRATGDVDAELRDVETARFELAVTGSAHVLADGAVTALDISSTGDSTIDARGLEAEDVDLTATGDAELSVFARRSIRAVLSGSSDLTVYGNPDSERVSTTGDSQVTYR